MNFGNKNVVNDKDDEEPTAITIIYFLYINIHKNEKRPIF